MNKLIIHTQHPHTVADLLKTYDLVESQPNVSGAVVVGYLEVAYPDDAISQALAFWFALAQGCGLVGEYELMHPWPSR